MSNTSFPTNPNNRKVIFVLHRFYFANQNYQSQLLENPQIYALRYPVDGQHNTIIRKLQEDGLITPGKILVQNPYDTDNYVEAVDAISSLALRKILHFSYFCQLLGAKKVFADRMEMVNTEGKVIASGGLKGPTPAFNGNVEFEQASFEKMKSQIKLDDSFVGIKPDVKEAENYLIKHNIGDVVTTDLLERWKQNLPLQSREINLNLTKESQKNLKIVLSLNMPTIAEVKLQIETLKKDMYEYNLTLKVEF